MKPLYLFLIGSLAINTVLAGFWIKSKRATAQTESVSETATATTSSSAKKAKQHSSSDTGVAVTDLTVSEIKPVSWLDIQSTDLKEFVARLRAAGCPDETVKDIILAEVNRRLPRSNVRSPASIAICKRKNPPCSSSCWAMIPSSSNASKTEMKSSS
jgi:hypothetical protein